MNRLILLFVALMLLSTTFAQNNCSIIDEYHKIFVINKNEYNGKFYFSKSVDSLEKEACFSKIVNQNKRLISYLLTNFSGNEIYKELEEIEDSAKIQELFIIDLKKDSVFSKEMKKLERLSQNINNFNYDTLSMDELINIAVKFFYINKITEEGHYSGKVCIGINGIEETTENRKPIAEAFCFTTVMNNYTDENLNLIGEFKKGIKNLYNFNLGKEKEDILKRAQGALYMYMSKNENLKKAILKEYKAHKKHLPFVIK